MSIESLTFLAMMLLVFVSLSWVGRSMLRSETFRIRVMKWSFVLVAGASLAAFGWITFSTGWLLIVGQRTTGIVVDSEVRRTTSRTTSRMHSTSAPLSTTTSYAPVIVFSTAEGTEVEFVSPLSVSERAPIGASVPVVYRQDNPRHARVNTFSHLWGGSLMSLILGLAFTIAAGFMWALDSPRREPSGGASL